MTVSIDGFGGNDVCQIGTVQAVTVAANGNVTKSCYAWFEWFPQSWQAISNFPVSMGDTLTGLLCIQSPTEAGFNLMNVTTGVHTGFTFDAPAGTTLVGNTAEWILERPGINVSTAQLPDFGEVYFDSAIASNSTNTAVDAGRRAGSGPRSAARTGHGEVDVIDRDLAESLAQPGSLDASTGHAAPPT